MTTSGNGIHTMLNEAINKLAAQDAALREDLEEARDIARQQKGEIEHLQGMIAGLEEQLRSEQAARQALEQIVAEVAKLVS